MNATAFHTFAATMAFIVAAPLALASPAATEPAPEHESREPASALLREAAEAEWIGFRIAWGRIESVMPREGSVEHHHRGSTGEETIGIVSDPGGGTLEYVASDVRGRLRLWLGRNGDLDIHWSPLAGPEVRFVQPAAREESLALSIGTGDERRDYAPATLWHLWIAHPDVARHHLAPLLADMLPRDLEDRVGAIEGALLRNAAESTVPRQADWRRHFHALADDRPARREAADAALRAVGPALWWFLKDGQPESEVEQEHRLRRIRRDLVRAAPDGTPASTADWLSGDARIWEALAHRADLKIQSLARAALSQLTADVAPSTHPKGLSAIDTSR